MKNYELLTIYSGALKEDELGAAIKEAKDLLKKHGGSITMEANWGRIKMAYEIKKQTHGTYLVWRLTMDPAHTNAFAGELQVTDHVIR
ncbi:MAG: 30S ribosomal protein S6, partial [bacterium]|nr:30S ribosomal protein S6 [bacterium]